MGNFEITETLRIYLPGLYFLIVIRYLTGCELSDTTIAILAVFAGLAINSLKLAEIFYLVYVEYFHGNFKFPKRYKHNLFLERKEAFQSRYDEIRQEIEEAEIGVLTYLKTCENDSTNREKNTLSKALVVFDSKRHHNEENKQMRLLSTFGHLKFLLSAISFIAFVSSFFYLVLIHFPEHFTSRFNVEQIYLNLFVFFIATIVFIHGAIGDKKLSLKFEVNLYKNYNKQDLHKIKDLILRELKVKEENR